MAAVGRREVWEALLAERGRAERVARSRCRSRQDAEDCVQEAMARVAAMPDVDLTRIGPLLSTVVAHLAVDGHRRTTRQQRAEPQLRALVIHEPGPEEAVCDLHEARWLWSQTSTLPAQDRAVLQARAAGRSAREAAALLDVTYKAAESSFSRARARMQAIWRATAGALGILWCGHGRRPRSATAAGAITAAAAAVMMLLPWVTVPGDAAPRPDGTRPPGFSSSSPRVSEPVGPMPPTAAFRSSVEAVQQPPTTASPAAARLLTTDPLDTPATGGFSATVTRERPEESLTQTLERCTREGVHLSLTRVGCRG